MNKNQLMAVANDWMDMIDPGGDYGEGDPLPERAKAMRLSRPCVIDLWQLYRDTVKVVEHKGRKPIGVPALSAKAKYIQRVHYLPSELWEVLEEYQHALKSKGT